MKNTHLKQHVADTVYIVAGAFIASFALMSFLVPNKFLDGGVTGMALLLHEIYHWNIAVVIVLANIPLIVLGGFQMNKTFAFKSIIGITILGLFMAFFPFPVLHYDKLLVSTFGGLFLGLGVGLGMRGGCALDGIEVLALYTLKRSSFTISEIILGLNVIIFAIAAFQFGFEIALYATLTYYIVTRTINYVIQGLEEFTGVTIISAKHEAIKQKLAQELGRGITIYKGERGFLKGSYEESYDTDIIFTVVTRLEVRHLRNIVGSIDEKAFIITHSIREASGGILKRQAGH